MVAKKTLYLGIAILYLVSVVFGFVSYRTAANALITHSEKYLTEKALDAAMLLESRIQHHITAVETVANRYVIRGMDWPAQAPVLEEEGTRLGYLTMAVVDTSGNARYIDGSILYLGDRPYVERALAGEASISDIILSRAIQEQVVMVAAPIMTAGQVQGALIARLSAGALSDFIMDISFGQTGYAYMIDNQGVVVAHADRELVLNEVNFIEEARTDARYESLAVVLKKMTERKIGVGSYPYLGTVRYVGFAPVEGTNWSVAVGAYQSEVLADLQGMQKLVGVSMFITLLVSILIALLINQLPRRRRRPVPPAL